MAEAHARQMHRTLSGSNLGGAGTVASFSQGALGGLGGSGLGGLGGLGGSSAGALSAFGGGNGLGQAGLSHGGLAHGALGAQQLAAIGGAQRQFDMHRLGSLGGGGLRGSGFMGSGLGGGLGSMCAPPEYSDAHGQGALQRPKALAMGAGDPHPDSFGSCLGGAASMHLPQRSTPTAPGAQLPSSSLAAGVPLPSCGQGPCGSMGSTASCNGRHSADGKDSAPSWPASNALLPTAAPAHPDGASGSVRSSSPPEDY